MMSELWLWRQCNFILVLMVRQLKAGIANCIAFYQGFKTGLVKIYDFVRKLMCSGIKLAADP